MKLSNFIEGLKTLQPYYTGGDGYHIGAEHDQFYAYATDQPLSQADVQKMRDLGWFQPEQADDAEYDTENGWSLSLRRRRFDGLVQGICRAPIHAGFRYFPCRSLRHVSKPYAVRDSAGFEAQFYRCFSAFACV